MTIRAIRQDDAPEWERMRTLLWPTEGSDHRDEIVQYFEGTLPEPMEVFVAEEDERLIGMIELSIRPYAEGCRSHGVAYIEGWYVDPEYRNRGIGRALVEIAEVWGREVGCSEIGSDTEVENLISTAAHQHLGFEVVGVIRTFRKSLIDESERPGSSINEN